MRFLLSWMGGFGLVTFAVLILPHLRVGGLQLFMVDLSVRPGKFLPRTAEVVARIACQGWYRPPQGIATSPIYQMLDAGPKIHPAGPMLCQPVSGPAG